MVGGDDEVSRYHDTEVAEEYDVEVRLKDVYRASSEVISKLYVPSTKSGMVRLDNVVQLDERASRLPHRRIESTAAGRHSREHCSRLCSW